MLKITTFVLSLIFFIPVLTVNGPNNTSGSTPDTNIIERYKYLTPQQLLDTAKHHWIQYDFDEALVCYTLLIDMVPHPNKDILIEAYYNIGIIHNNKNDFSTAYEMALKALELSETVNDTLYMSRSNVLIGLIYSVFDEHDLAIKHFSDALRLNSDNCVLAQLWNNIGNSKLNRGDLEDAYFLFKQSLQVTEQRCPTYIWGNAMLGLAMLYMEKEVYDSAYFYFRKLIDEPDITVDEPYTLRISWGFGRLFFEINQLDSALFYLNRSKSLATKYDVPFYLIDYYLLLSKIAESKGQHATALEYFKQYSDIKDSLFNRKKIFEISRQRLAHEDLKNKQQQQVREQSIRHRQRISLGILISVCVVLVLVLFHNRRLREAHKKLVEKNMKIIKFEEHTPESHHKKYKNNALTDDMRDEILTKILVLMEDTSIVCSMDFTLDKLADLVQSNHAYVSQVINVALKKNFRTFINEYRIREAQRLFLEADASKFTIETIANKTGFKSRTTFISAFKEITGVSPSFYLKSVREQ